jgi:hypothetical protein
LLEMLKNLDWAQKRFQIIKSFQKYNNYDFKKFFIFFQKKKNIRKS